MADKQREESTHFMRHSSTHRRVLQCTEYVRMVSFRGKFICRMRAICSSGLPTLRVCSICFGILYFFNFTTYGTADTAGSLTPSTTSVGSTRIRRLGRTYGSVGARARSSASFPVVAEISRTIANVWFIFSSLKMS